MLHRNAQSGVCTDEWVFVTPAMKKERRISMKQPHSLKKQRPRTSTIRLVAVLVAGLVALLAACGAKDPSNQVEAPSDERTSIPASLKAATDSMVIEVEQARWTASGGERVSRERTGVWLSANEVGGVYGFSQAVPEGAYSVTLRIAMDHAYGTYRIDVNGRSIGVIDGFVDPSAPAAGDDSVQWKTVKLGNATSTGAMRFELVHIGGAVDEKDDHLRIDSITLTPLPSPFRAYWSFEAAEAGLVTDSTGHGFPLTLSGATLDSSGAAGRSLGLLGAEASALVASEVLNTSASFSISLWAELDQLHDWDTLASQDGQNVSAFYLQKRDNDRLAFTTLSQDSTSSGACVALGNVQPKVGQWYHLVASWNATTQEQRLYIDGVLAGLASCPGAFKATGPLVLGRGRWEESADWMRGRVDEMGVVDRALSPAEVVDLYRALRPDASDPIAGVTMLKMREQTWSVSARARVVEGRNGVRLLAKAIGDTFTFRHTVPAGLYRAAAHVQIRKDSGAFDVVIDGRSVATIDGAGSPSQYQWTAIDLGMVVSNGAMDFTFVFAGPAAAGSTRGFEIDWISLEPSPFESYWSFESQTNGQVPDISGHGLPLTLENASLAPGPNGGSLALAGDGSSATAPSGVLDTSASFSVSVWATLDELGSWNTFVSQDGQNLSAFFLQKRDSQLVAFTTFPEDDTSAAPCIASGALRPKAGEWYHFVATRDAASGEQRIYVDGVLSGKAVCVGGFKSAGPLVVGRGRWGGPVDFMKGGVDDLGVAHRVLTADEVLELYRKGRPNASYYLFAYFSEQALGRGDGLRLAQSHDGLSWGGIGANKVFLPPTVGGKSFRDPHVMRDPQGNYRLVWTTSCVPWAEPGCMQDRGFGHAFSKDLVHWSEPTYVPVDLPLEHVWAPETFYDEATRTFMVYWSSPLDVDPAGYDPHSIYAITTLDFRTFTAPAVLYSQPGRDFIDATIRKQGSGYLMFLKDEAGSERNIRVLTSSSPFQWTAAPSEKLTGNYGAEGPSVMERDGRLYLYFDKYGEGSYGALRSRGLTALSDPASWEDISSSVSFPGVRHGTPIEVPWEVFRTVALKAGESR